MKIKRYLISKDFKNQIVGFVFGIIVFWSGLIIKDCSIMSESKERLRNEIKYNLTLYDRDKKGRSLEEMITKFKSGKTRYVLEIEPNEFKFDVFLKQFHSSEIFGMIKDNRLISDFKKNIDLINNSGIAFESLSRINIEPDKLRNESILIIKSYKKHLRDYKNNAQMILEEL